PSKARSIAELEYIVREYAASLKSVIQNTRENVERKQVLTDMERDQEMLEENEVEIQESEDEDEEHIYNPLKLPLGWDGKPIPYWLYKLHGLGVEYNCEICGNYIYRGRKAFDKHFQESRHTTNMRRLGIPNTRQFHDITKIEDALALWEKIKRQQSTTTINQDTFEEFEDEEGNVFS
ncbi:Pre-mRNA-splicing factor sap61, partial [Spiromyces aspiralis]